MLRRPGILRIISMVVAILNETRLRLRWTSIIIHRFCIFSSHLFLAAQQGLFVDKVLDVKCGHLIFRFLLHNWRNFKFAFDLLWFYGDFFPKIGFGLHKLELVLFRRWLNFLWNVALAHVWAWTCALLYFAVLDDRTRVGERRFVALLRVPSVQVAHLTK